MQCKRQKMKSVAYISTVALNRYYQAQSSYFSNS